MKRWYYSPLTYGFMMLLGVFEVFVLRFPEDSHVMNLFAPILASQPILTSWWMLWIGYTFGVPLYLFGYEYFIIHKKPIEILKEINPFKK